MDAGEPTNPNAADTANPVDAYIGDRLCRRRELLDMSREILALRSGVISDRLAEIESGACQAEPNELYALAGVLGVKVHYFYDRAAIAPAPPAKSWIREVERWFGANISPYERDFLGIARRMTGDLDTARDVVHDAYAKVLSENTWAKVTHPRAYVMRIIYNLGLNRLRDAKVVPMQQYAKVETVSYADMGPDAFETLSSRQEVERLMEAISRLPPQCRKVVMMRKIEELRPRDIASQLGISLSMVEKHLARGLVLLADYLDVIEVERVEISDNQDAATAPK